MCQDGGLAVLLAALRVTCANEYHHTLYNILRGECVVCVRMLYVVCCMVPVCVFVIGKSIKEEQALRRHIRPKRLLTRIRQHKPYTHTQNKIVNDLFMGMVCMHLHGKHVARRDTRPLACVRDRVLVARCLRLGSPAAKPASGGGN